MHSTEEELRQLERYRSGDLRTHSLRLEDSTTRVYGTAAVTVGRHVQQAEYRGQAVNGEFRATHIAIRDGSRWRLAGLHLSPIGGLRPSPQVTPTGMTRDEGHQRRVA